MKKVVFLLIILLAAIGDDLQAQQPTNSYIFEFYGSCEYGAEVRSWPDLNLIIDVPQDRVPRSVNYSFQSSFYLEYQIGSSTCPTASRKCDFPSNTTYCMLNQVEPTAGGVQCYWLPIVSSLSAREYSTGYSSSIDANSNQHPIPTRDIFSNRTIEVLPTSDYTGTDYHWQIVTNTDVKYTVSGGYFRMSARDIALRIGYNTDFWIQPQTPSWSISGTTVSSTYRNTWQITQKLRIYNAHLTATEDPQCIKSSITITVTSDYTQTVDLRILQNVYMVGYDHNLPGHTGFTINPGTHTITVTYDQIKQTPIDFGQTFGFGLYFANSDEYIFSDHSVGHKYYEPLSNLTITTSKYCQESPTGGSLILERVKTDFEERFDFKDAAGCSTAVAIDTAYMEEGEDNITIPGIIKGSYCVGRVRVMSDGSTECEQTDTFSIKTYPKPGIAIQQVMSPWCQDANATVYLDPGLTNGTGKPTFNLYNISRTYNQSLTDYVAYFYGVNLEAEDYYAQLTDPAGCKSDIDTIEAHDASPITFDVDSTRPDCYGDPEGIITISNVQGGPVNGTTYQYSIGSGWTSGTEFIGLPGDYKYDVSVRDANAPLCNTTIRVTVGQPDSLTYSNPAYEINNIECHGDPLDGSIRLYGGGGTAPLYYNFASGAESFKVGINETIWSIPAGIYYGWLSDDHNCSSDTIRDLEITESPKIIVDDFDVTKESCLSTFDGSIEILSTHGGDGDFTYHWSNGQTGAVATGLHAGINYTLTVTDGLSCSRDTLFVLKDPDPITVSLESSAPICPGESTGILIINNIEKGNPGYTYSLDSDTNYIGISAGDIIDSLKPGNHTLHIRDSKYNDSTYKTCSTDFDFFVPDKKRIELLKTVIDTPLCYGDSNAVIKLINFDGPGDTSKYTFEWFDEHHIMISQSRNLHAVPSGTYEVTIFDEQGCSSESFGDLSVIDPPELLIDSVLIDSASCIEVANGSITVFPSGGTKTNYYHYSIGDTFLLNHPVFSNLDTGTYSISVRDDNGCTASVDTTIEAGKVLLELTDTSMVTCHGDHDGTIRVTGSGGKDIYRYFIDGPGLQTDTLSPIFTGLEPGVYQLYAHDENTTCESKIMDIDITEPDSLVVTATLVDSSACGLNLGIVSYLIEGGNGGNTVRWKDVFGSQMNENNLNALVTGFYKVTVEDKNACYAEDTITVPDRPGPVITGHEVLKPTYCGEPLGVVELHVEKGSPEFTYQWNFQQDLNEPIARFLAAGTYQVTVTDRYGCLANYTFKLEDGPALSPSAITTDANCDMNNGTVLLEVNGGVPPYFYQWPDSVSELPLTDVYMDSLYAGEYEVVITDSVGCDTAFFVELANLDGPEASAGRITSPWCSLPTGTASVHITKGELPYAYEWRKYGNDSVLSVSTLIVGIPSGQYIFRVIDRAGCIDVLPVILSDSVALEPQLSFVSMDSSACSKPLGSLAVEMSGGLPPYHYQWNTSVDDTLNTANSLTAGNYFVTATDERGCTESLELEVADRAFPKIRFLKTENAYCGLPSGSFSLRINRGVAPYFAYLTDNPGKTYPFAYTDSIDAYTALIDSLYPSQEPYSVQAADADACESNSLSNYIDDENPMQISLLSVLPVSCYGKNDGTATVRADDGIEPYSYAWSKNSVNAPVNNNLSGGAFTVTVTDAAGCLLQSESYTVPEPSQVRITNTIITKPTCFGICDGQITGYAAGGTGQLRYIWNHIDTIRTETGLCAGDVTLDVIDANGCSTSTNLSMDEPPMEDVPGMPDQAEVCDGQQYILSPGEEYTDCNWTSTNGFTGNTNSIAVTEAGTYFLSATSPKGCAVADTFMLIVSDNLLNAEFLMASDAYVGDTVVIIEVSWPYADICSWNIPPEATVITDLDYYKELIFHSAGTYYIELNARLATCVAMQGKYIDIYNSVPDKSSQEPADDKDSIISSFTIFPNPARESLTIRVKLQEEEDIRVEVVSLGGKMVNNVVAGYDMSEYEVSLDVTSLMPGMYLIRLIAGDNIETKMLVVR
jgi:hypothetical protein